MDCSTFRDNHAAYIDGVLGERALVAMQCHVRECPACAEHDTAVRRALLLFRNMPAIEPSPDFSARLHERIRAARGRDAPAYRQGPGLSAFAAAAAVVVATGYVAVGTFNWATPTRELALMPVVATASPARTPPARQPREAPQPAESPESPESPGSLSQLVRAVGEDDATPSPLTSPTIVASVSAGLPVWPAAFLAQEAPMHFAASEFKLVSLSP
jgi:Putative zinc-finger